MPGGGMVLPQHRVPAEQLRSDDGVSELLEEFRVVGTVYPRCYRPLIRSPQSASARYPHSSRPPTPSTPHAHTHTYIHVQSICCRWTRIATGRAAHRRGGGSGSCSGSASSPAVVPRARTTGSAGLAAAYRHSDRRRRGPSPPRVVRLPPLPLGKRDKSELATRCSLGT